MRVLHPNFSAFVQHVNGHPVPIPRMGTPERPPCVLTNCIVIIIVLFILYMCVCVAIGQKHFLTESFWSIQFCLLVVVLSIRTFPDNWYQWIWYKCFLIRPLFLGSTIFAVIQRRPWCRGQRMCTFDFALAKIVNNRWERLP